MLHLFVLIKLCRNAGDSITLLCSGETLVSLRQDHKPDNPE